MMSKHEQIIQSISLLEAGTKISVRTIANDHNVSDGTAYRAIKECEAMGIVTTIPRVGTVKVDKVKRKSIEALNFEEVVNIVDGVVLGGEKGIHKTLNKFLIGAMTDDAVSKYIDPGCLLIVGNREDIQKLALLNNAAVLIAGGFECTSAIKKLADDMELPVISSSYDSFTIATMINKAISESLIKKDIILVEDIMNTGVHTININTTVGQWKKLTKIVKQDKYVVLDDNENPAGMLDIKDVDLEAENSTPISRFITKDIITVSLKTTAAYAAHMMGWENIEICAVVDNGRFVGIVDRQNIIKALQYVLRQPQVGESLEDIVLKNFNYEYTAEGGIHFKGKIVSEMLSPVGIAFWSSLNMLLSAAGVMTLRHRNNINITVDSISTYFIKPVQIDSLVEIFTKVLDTGRTSSKVEVAMFDINKDLMSKLILSAKIFRK